MTKRPELGALVLAVALGVGAVSAPAPVEAQRVDIDTPHRGRRPFQLDFHAGFTWWGVGAATGVRFGIPLVENGFVESINNAVYLNFGADFYWVRWEDRGSYWEYSYAFGFPVTLHWEFYLNDDWSVFAEVGGQFFMHPRWLRSGNFDVYDDWGYWFIASAGGSWHISDFFLLTVRVGTPYVAGGITLQF